MDRYFKFLCNIVKGEIVFDLLLRHLHRIEYYSFVPNDDNRGEDGKRLRDIFLNEENSDLREMEDLGPCTVLEMLIGLSYRIENELEDGPAAMKAPSCFWMLINNLELEWVNNNAYVQEGGAYAIDEKISVLLDRKYSRNGHGGLFPLNHTRNDQRNIEIWYQMQEYLLENYDF